MHAYLRPFAFTTLACLLALASGHAQTTPAATAQTKPAATEPADADVVTDAPPKKPAERAWPLITDALAPTQRLEPRVQALAALATMGTNARAAELITTSLTDKSLDVRAAAALAAGQTKNPRLLPALRKALNDPEPQVAYTAAVVLWKMKDHSGEDLLMDVADGERRGNATLLRGARHSAALTLHDPTALATIGIEQGAGLLLGPFGIGIAAVEYARKNGGDSTRATAIDLLAEQHTPAVHQEFLDGLKDKDPIVRAASAKALGQWPGAETAAAVALLFDDSKLPVRVTAAATYIRVSGARRAPATSAKPKAN
jgi:HEAT repeat protein